MPRRAQNTLLKTKNDCGDSLMQAGFDYSRGNPLTQTLTYSQLGAMPRTVAARL